MIMKNSLNEFSLRTNTLIKVSQMKSAIHWCNWKAIWLLLIVFGGGSVVGQATDLIISEYVEGSGNNKYIEVFNGTGNSVDLANYSLRLYSNGSASVSSSVVLSGTLHPNQTKVFNNSGASIYNGTSTTSTQITAVLGFNGDDAIAIYNNSTSTFADIFGVIGCDPGTTWTSSSIQTLDKTLRRKSTVCTGVSVNPNPTPCNSSSFTTLSSEWEVSNIDVVSGLGTHQYNCSYNNLTIPLGYNYNLPSGSQLTVTGTLTNNGTLTIESGATFLQGPSSSLAGNGTYNVKQFVTGAGGATPTGRFWYMGVPVNNLSRATAFGTASGSNRLWSWSESGQAWSSQLVDATALTPTTGYSFRTGSDVTLNFSGTSLYSADPSISGLTNTTGSFSGCHLMSNPFTAYADWEQIYTASTNISSTYCVRSFNTANSQMVYDTYNATGDVAVQNGSYAVTRYIAPMQSFWIIVDPSTTGTFNMTKSMLSHQPSATGLKDLSTFNAFARLNLIGGNLSDQVVVYMTPDATNALDAYDSKKMMLSNVPQVYTILGTDKLVINGLKESKAHTIVPLTLELPNSQSYHFEMAESNVNYGLVILEDREELVFQDMTANPDYAFFAQAGISSDRFVLHFHFPLNTASTDEIGSSAQIDIVSNNTGAVNVHLSDDLQVGGEITVLDQSGRLVAKKTITQAQTLVQINETAGVYFVRVQTPGKTEMKKVVLY